jgi:hypothetical protein
MYIEVVLVLVVLVLVVVGRVIVQALVEGDGNCDGNVMVAAVIVMVM